MSPSKGQVAHALLTRPPLGQAKHSVFSFTKLQITNLVLCALCFGKTHSVLHDPVRLACIRHAASVRPEPGSNSQYMVSLPDNSLQITDNRYPLTAMLVKTLLLIAFLALKRIFQTLDI